MSHLGETVCRNTTDSKTISSPRWQFFCLGSDFFASEAIPSSPNRFLRHQIHFFVSESISSSRINSISKCLETYSLGQLCSLGELCWQPIHVYPIGNRLHIIIIRDRYNWWATQESSQRQNQNCINYIHENMVIVLQWVRAHLECCSSSCALHDFLVALFGFTSCIAVQTGCTATANHRCMHFSDN